MPDERTSGGRGRGRVPAERLIAKLGEGGSGRKLGDAIARAKPGRLERVVDEAPDDEVRELVENAPDEQLKTVVSRVPPERLKRVIEKVPEARRRAVVERLPKDVVTRLRRRGFPFDGLPDDRRTELAIVRPEDLVVMRVAFAGLRWVRGNPPSLRADGGGAHRLTITLPPQHTLEESFRETAAEGGTEDARAVDEALRRAAKALPERGAPAKPAKVRRFVTAPELFSDDPKLRRVTLDALKRGPQPAPPPVRAQLSGPTRLVFDVPDGATIPLTVEGILEALTRFDLRLPPAVAQAKEPPSIEDLLAALRRGRGAPPDRGPGAWASSVLAARDLRAVRTGMLSRTRRVDLDLPRIEALRPALPAPPRGDETAIELPHRLLIAPDKGAAWTHPVAPAQAGGRTELWTSRLGRRRPGGGVDARGRRSFRAVWTRDLKDERVALDNLRDSHELDLSLNAKNRYEIVQLTSNSKIQGGYLPVHVDDLALSSLGAWLRSEGRWDVEGYSLLMWRHRASMGRDVEVRIVEKGYLLPFGHQAAKLEITERKFHPQLPHAPAYLRTRTYVVVRQPERVLGEGGTEHEHQLPFRRVRIATRITPALDEPENLVDDKGPQFEEVLFWPKVAGRPVRFALEALDHGGRELQFRLPLLFVDESYLHNHGPAKAKAAQEYEAADDDWRTVGAQGALVAYAEPREPDDTTFATRSMVLGVGVPAKPSAAQPPWLVPVMRTADIEVPALKQFAADAARMRVGYHAGFLKDGFAGAGAGEVFLESAEPVELDFDHRAESSGGFLTPNFAIGGLSRRLGPVGGDLAEYASGGLSYEKIFAGLGARIFGVIDLWQILEATGIDDAVPKIAGQALDAAQAFLRALEQLDAEARAAGEELGALGPAAKAALKAVGELVAGTPRSLGEVLDPLRAQLESTALAQLAASTDAAKRRVARRVAELQRTLAADGFAEGLEALAQGAELATGGHARMQWRPRLKAGPDVDGIPPVFKPRRTDGLTLAVDIAPDLTGGGTPETSVSCTLVDFDLDLGPIVLEFEKVELAIEPGQKPDVDVVFGAVRFEEELKFVQTLTEILPMDGFSDPPDLTVTEEGITASFTTNVPSVAVGVLGLTDVSLGASCRVPLIGASPLSFRFDFCDPKRPAQLTVGMFGGGAYFGVEVQPLGGQSLVALRGAFEFGAGLAMDFGVASGSVTVRAGIYFELGGDGSLALTGYFRARGEVDVLGLLSVSIELRLELSYKDGKLKGRAELEIEIEIAWFSTTVTVTCERQFAGGNADPTFLEIMAPVEAEGFDPWSDYCRAFA